jgi:glutathione peroxidase
MSIYDQTFKISTGEDIPLSEYKDKVLLIVNVATNCGFTPQYKALQDLHDRYSEAGLHIIAFPCNQFGGQEPGTDAEIADFCSTNYGVTFEFASKSAVLGEEANPVHKYIANEVGHEAPWNFTKYIIDLDGKIHETSPDTDPLEMEPLIKYALRSNIEGNPEENITIENV